MLVVTTIYSPLDWQNKNKEHHKTNQHGEIWLKHPAFPAKGILIKSSPSEIYAFWGIGGLVTSILTWWVISTTPKSFYILIF